MPTKQTSNPRSSTADSSGTATLKSTAPSSSANSRTFTPQQFLSFVAENLREGSSQPKAVGLREQFYAKNISPIVLLAVSDHLRSRNFVKSLESLLAGNRAGALATQFYFGTELNSTDKFDAVCNTLLFRSLFSNADLLIIYDIESAKTAVQKKLAEKMTGKTIEPIVVCTVSAPPGSRDASAFVQELAQSALIINVPDLTPSTLPKWIESQAKTAGSPKGISAEGAAKLINVFGNDPVNIYQELEKLALLTPLDRPIDLDLITSICAHQPESAAQELLLSMAKKDIRLSFEICRRLIAQGQHPLQICSFLSTSFRLILAEVGKTKLPHGKKSSLEIKTGELNKPWMISKLQPIKALFSFRELRLTIQTLRDLDFSLKSSGVDPEVATTIAVCHIASRSFNC